MWRRSSSARIALGAVALIAVATAVSVALLWPSGDAPGGEGALVPSDAEVTALDEVECPGGGSDPCRSLEARLEDGPEEGALVQVQLSPVSLGLEPAIEVGDRVKLTRIAGSPGRESTYVFADFQRGATLLWLALAFTVLVLVFGRIRGALSLVGLLASLVIVLVFVVPAIREGEPALAVALSGSLAVMLVTIGLAHGLGVKSVAAMLGTAASLVLVVALAAFFTEAAELTGLISKEASFLALLGSGVSLRGLLLAGMVIGALGVLDDVTISQSSTVIAIRAADPSLPARELYHRAIDVGRDHVSATVNTLVLAYLGASLPILLIFSSGNVGFIEALNRELVAAEIVATLVGSIGLIAAVPLTTLIAAVLVARLPTGALVDQAERTHLH